MDKKPIPIRLKGSPLPKILLGSGNIKNKTTPIIKISKQKKEKYVKYLFLFILIIKVIHFSERNHSL